MSSRTIPVPDPPQEAHFIEGSTSCPQLPRVKSSDSVMIATSTPCGTPPRKKWEGAFNTFLRGKNQEHSPTMASSPSSSITSIPIAEDPTAEDWSTGTGASASSSGGMKGHKKKNSFSLIPGSRRFVTRNGSNKGGALPAMFAKGSTNGHNSRFSRGHKSMDALDVPLRKGMQKVTSDGAASSNPASPSRTSLIRQRSSPNASTNRNAFARQRSSPRSSPKGTQPPLPSCVPENTAEDPLLGIGLLQERTDNKTSIMISTTPPTTSALDDQLRASAISSSSFGHQYPPNVQIERVPSADLNINPIVNAGVELPQATLSQATISAPSLIRLPQPRSHSRTYMYSSNSNTSTPVYQYQQPHHDELDLRMMPEFPSLKGLSSNHSRTGLSDFNDVGLNLDDSENCNMDDANQQRQNHFEPAETNYTNSNTSTIITDSGMPEPPESLDELFGGIDGMVSVHSSSSSQLLGKIAASPETKKAFTKIHNSSEYAQDISPFLGGNKASNLDLAGAHKSCIATQQSMLLRSMSSNQKINNDVKTQFGSIPHGIYTREGHNSPLSFLSQSLPLDTFLDDNRNTKGSRMLKPIQSADSWAQGRRYLIAPAALAACPLNTIKSLTSLCSQSVTEAALSMDPPKASGVIELGDAFMTYVGDKYYLTCGKWSPCKLVLRQNCLFEYDLSAPIGSLPRGIGHLQHAVARAHQEFQDALELHFYGSPCAKVDHKVLLIRVKNMSERDHWITCLNKAARLQIEDIWEYNEDQPLGSGRYASIFPARRRTCELTSSDEERLPKDDRGNNCALKIIDKHEFWQLVVKGRERCDTIVREVAVQSTLTAKFGTKPTFLQIHGFFETAEKVVIELELLDGKDLFEYISSKGVLEEEEAGVIIRDVLVALNSMSRAGIAHRDVKPANILMARCDGSKYGTSVKLADFGMSTLVGVDGLVKGRCGSPGYVAPEILKAEAGEGYRNRVDMFSTGVTLYLMLCGYEPFYGESEKALIKANEKARIDFPDSEWSKISPEAKDLVTQMLKADPSERISAQEAIKHPWIVRLSEDQKRYGNHPESNDDSNRNPELDDGVCAIM